MLIHLTQGLVTLIDDEDFSLISKYKWHASKSKCNYYARTDVRTNGQRKAVYMHRFLLGCTPEQEGHHKDGNSLNNQRVNLIACNRKINLSYRKYGGDK